MARASIIARNNKRTKMIQKYYLARQKLKTLIYDKSIDISDRMKYVAELGTLPKDGSRIRHRTICKISGRTRGCYSKTLNGLSRIALRTLAASGDIPGMIKSSW